MIIVVETIRAIKGKRAELKKALTKIVPISRKSKGCLQYDLFEPIEEGDEFLVLMRWESISDLRGHESSDYIDEFVRKYDKILYDEVHVTEWKEIL